MIGAASLFHTLPLQNADRSESELQTETLSCSLQPTARRALLSHSRGRDNCFDSSLQQCQRGELYSKRERLSVQTEALTNAAHVHACDCKHILVQINAHCICERSCEKVCFGVADPWILFLQQSQRHCFNHKPLCINPQRSYCRAERGFLSQWLTVIIIEREWAQVLSNVQKLCLQAS